MDEQRLQEAEAWARGDDVFINLEQMTRRALIAEVRRLRQEQEWWTAVNAELLPYQERAVKAEQQRDAALAERDALLVQVDQWRQTADREVTACVEMRAERDAYRRSVEMEITARRNVEAERDVAQQEAAAVQAQRDEAWATLSQARHTHAKELADAQHEATAMRRERDEEITERVLAERSHDGAWAEANGENDRHIQRITELEAALTEARRVLRLVDKQARRECPVCFSPGWTHGPNCALAAVLAQEANK